MYRTRQVSTDRTPKYNIDEPIKVSRLLAYIKPYLSRLAVAFVALTVAAAIGLVFPYVISTLIDGVLFTGDISTLNRIALSLIGLFVVRFFFGYVQRYYLEYSGERIVIDVRTEVYRHLQSLPVKFFTERRSGEIVSRLASDATLIRSALTNNMATLLNQGLTLIGAVVIVFFINWRLTLMVLGIAPVIGLISALFGRLVRARSTDVQDQLADSSAIVEESVQGVRVVKSFVREDYEVGRYNTAMQRTFDAAMSLTKIRAAFGPLTFSIMFMAIVGVLWFGGREVIAERLSVGELTSFLFYLLFIAGAFGSFTGLYTQLQEAAGAAQRIFEILDTKPEIDDKPDAITLSDVRGQITFDGVTFNYGDDGGPDVLQDINLTIQPGEVLALVGPSGAGKSTIVNLIPRFYDPTAGRIMIDGTDLRDVTQKSLRAQIGIVPQETQLFSGSIHENILYGRLDASEEELVEAARAANAHDFIMKLANGYDTAVGERGVKLSGGQRQRVAIARALLKNPRILLLDEATSSLDSESEELVQEALDHLMQGRTTIIIAHRLSTVQIADRIAVLDDGHIVEYGTHTELLNQPDGLYHRLYTIQFEAGLVGGL